MSNSLKILVLQARKHLLLQRDPVANNSIVHKIERQIRKLSKV